MESESDAAVVEREVSESVEPSEGRASAEAPESANEPEPAVEAEVAASATENESATPADVESPQDAHPEAATEAAASDDPEATEHTGTDTSSEAATDTPSETATDGASEAEPATIAPPVVRAIEPSHGPATRATRVRVVGEGFQDGCVVRVGDTALATARDDDGALVVELLANEAGGYVDFAIVNPDGGRELRPNAFGYDLPPWIASVEPSIVQTVGGATVGVVGKGFAEGAIVRIDGAVASSTRVSDERVDVVVPAHAEGSARVEVETPDGQRGALDDALTYAEGPVAIEVVPASGPPSGGTEIVVVGRNFRPGMRVTFFDAYAPEILAVENDTKLRLRTPAHAAGGSGALVVVDPDGLRHRLDNAFTYRDAEPPRIDGVSPARGVVTGGARLSITGRGFDARAVVRLGDRALEVEHHGPELVRVVTPSVDAPCALDVTVENPDGQRATLAAGFSFVPVPAPPKLIAVKPDRARTSGGRVVLVGDNFDEDTMVRVGEVTATRRLLGRTELEVDVPARAGAGPVAVELLAPGGVVVRVEGALTYEDRPPPRITSVSPANGPTGGGTRLVIEGEHLGDDVSIRIGREAPKSVLVRKPNRLEVLTAPSKSAGFVDIEITAPGLPAAVQKSGFRYDALPAPVVTSVAPPKGGVAGGTELGISGKNFVKESIVLVGGKPAKKTKFVDASNLEAITPPGDAGQMVDVVVRNPDGKEAVAKRAFLYDPRYR